MTSPRLSFADKGKAKLNLPDTVAAKLTDMVTAVTKAWTKQKLAEIRHADAVSRRTGRAGQAGQADDADGRRPPA